MLDSSLVFDGTFNTTTDAPTGVAITASATTQASTNIIDLLSNRDIGVGDSAELHVDITVAGTTTNSATLKIDFQTCATTNGTYVSLLTTPVYAASNLIAGAPLFRYPLPINQLQNATTGILAVPGRYLRLLYTVGTGVFTTLSVFSYINARQDRVQYTTYPANYTAAAYAGEI